MRIDRFKRFALILAAGYFLLGPVAFAASLSPSLQKAKQEAEAKGLIFLNSHDEIVNTAKKEGRMKAVCSLQSATVRALQESFKTEYPFLDVSVVDTTGTEANERLIMELSAGRDIGIDSTNVSTANFSNFLPFMKKFDILGMSEQGVLNIHPKFVDPVNRNIVGIANAAHVVVYNKKLVSADKVPDTWEGFLKPEFKGRKFLADILATEVATLVPVWGLEKTLDFARKLAAQQPIWCRGGTRMLTTMAAGEYALFFGPNLNAIMRLQAKDPSGSLAYKFAEPVPVRIVGSTGIVYNAKNPHAALLFWEFLLSPKGQKILDQYEPVSASIYWPNAYIMEAIKGKKVSVVGWDHFTKMDGYMAKVIEAYGFPKAEAK